MAEAVFSSHNRGLATHAGMKHNSSIRSLWKVEHLRRTEDSHLLSVTEVLNSLAPTPCKFPKPAMLLPHHLLSIKALRYILVSKVQSRIGIAFIPYRMNPSWA